MRSLAPKLLAAAVALIAVLVWAPAAGAAPMISGTVALKSELGTNNGVIVKVSGVEPPATTTTNPPPTTTNPITATQKPVPDTKVAKGPKKVIKVASGKATVRFTFSSSIFGARFQCRLVKAPVGKAKKKKTPVGSFSACSSPKVLKLGPGKYRFAVRAVADGAADPTPAERAFKVLRSPRHR
ncbi:MAG: hypothetical protein J0H06_03430 [Actinobacteria bacterium]|nr:hypothetical protein [Actinomycetota bacterium]OJU84819.1 MAG: hypothetical protein BGO11_03090 [Solirubrobacterales bacterium 70-9]